MDADFNAPARSKNEFDSSEEENKRMVELFNVWSKINADDLSDWVGVGRCVSDRWEKNKKNTESKESKRNVVHVSGQWVWAFFSEEEQKENR